MHHIENAAVPRLGRCPHLTGNITDFLIHTIEHPGQITQDAARSQSVMLAHKKSIRAQSSFLGPSRQRRKGPGLSRGTIIQTG
jgi:hypothetical protein